jgi:hypothetical protein
MANKLELPRDEMAIRKIYKKLVNQQELTTVFRPGKRVCGDFRGYCPQEKIKVRIVDKVGADWAMLPPEFIPNFIKEVEIISTEVIPLGGLKIEHFSGSSPDVKDKESLIHHLGIIYNLDRESLVDDFLITRINFRYL